VDGLAEWDRDSSAHIPIEELRAADDEIWHGCPPGAMRISPSGDRPGRVPRPRRHHDRRAGSAHKGERIAVVCHGGVINAYLATVLALDRMLFFSPDYTSIRRWSGSAAGCFAR
jgi:probable phosphoglycerate mutase